MPIEKGLKLVNSLEITEALIIESGPGKASRLLHRSNGFPELPGLNPGL